VISIGCHVTRVRRADAVSLRSVRHRVGAHRPVHRAEASQRRAAVPARTLREYLGAILYVLRTGCASRHIPHDVTVGWSAAHKHFLRWCRSGTWAKVLTAVRGEVRTRSGRRRLLATAMVDSSSVKASPVVDASIRRIRRHAPTLEPVTKGFATRGSRQPLEKTGKHVFLRTHALCVNTLRANLLSAASWSR
jgi:transposase